MTASELESLQEYVLRSHGYTVNVPETIGGSESVHVGIVDSIYDVPEPSDGSHDVINRQCCIDTDEGQPNPHGYWVFDILRYFGYGYDFSVFRAVDGEGNVSIDAFAKAIRIAIEHEVDILNVSAGKYLEGCAGHCPFCTAARRALGAGITVVAAAGNQHPDDPPERVNCPATRTETIAVNGMQVDCPVEVDDDNAVIGGRSGSNGPYWVKKQSEVDYQPTDAEGTFCGQRECTGGQDCVSRNTERPWSGNVRAKPGKPDVAAPVHYPTTTPEGVPVMSAGTSFAAPVVSGTLALVYSELQERKLQRPSPRETKAAVVDAGAPIGSTPERKLNATRTLNFLSDC